MPNCLRCGDDYILEDDMNVTEDKDFYCEECKEGKWWKDKFGEKPFSSTESVEK